MRLTVRLIASLILGIALVTVLFTRNEVGNAKQQTKRELQARASILADSLKETVVPLLGRRTHRQLQRIVERFGNREHLAGVAVFDPSGEVLAATPGLDALLKEGRGAASRAVADRKPEGKFFHFRRRYTNLYALPLEHEETMVGALVLFHDAHYIEAQSAQLWRNTFLRVLAQVVFIVLVTLLIVQRSITRPIARTAQWMRELRTGRVFRRPSLPEGELFKPLTREVAYLVKSLETARAAAEEEARLREAGESLWTAERLRAHIRSKLQEDPLFVVSNREPYMHVRRGKSIEAVVPASGLVTALEPVLRASKGTWIAHGSGSADREVVDERDSVPVPPDEPEYTLRRVWLTKEEEEGYYYGFANEGLWPLCHIAHTRPVFRAPDWKLYRQVNEKFARAVLEEISRVERAMLLAQDYHFALLPRLIKEQRPDTRVAIFWHTPWPNPEAFRICPWERELLDGLLGADLIGFHIQEHCNNFLETVDRALESKVEWERFAVSRGGHSSLVRPFPISVALAEPVAGAPPRPSPYVERAALLRELGVTAQFMGVGVDRVDYTKGILERFRGLERLFEKWPHYAGKFTFVQIGAPSRTHIPRYHDLLGEVEREADRINWRFQTSQWKPIVFLNRHHSHAEIAAYYRSADLCLVTSLHDGMNLVAKEFVAARDDEQGALILSAFTGASRELRDAFIVNPYDTEQLAEAIRFALEMDPEERSARMQRMRRIVRESNVYRWAGSLITELAEVRVEQLATDQA